MQDAWNSCVVHRRYDMHVSPFLLPSPVCEISSCSSESVTKGLLFFLKCICLFELASLSFIKLSFNLPAFPHLLNQSVCIYRIINTCYDNVTGIR